MQMHFAFDAAEAVVIPFPSVRRVGMIDRVARRAAEARDPEPTIRECIRRMRSQRGSCGLPIDVAIRDIAEFEGALRRRLEQYLGTFGRDAG
jgi:hypothetical protein